MIHDIDRKPTIKNAWRITRDRDKTCLRIRVPGGHLKTRYLALIQTIADTYGNGTLHLTTRQGFEIPGIKWEHREAINALLKPLVTELAGSDIALQGGYPAAGTRNISACIGSRVCPFANDDTTRIALEIEHAIYPHDFHFKVAVTGCPNDCIKAHMQDFGIICMTLPQYNQERCISCSACVDVCKKKVTNALSIENFDVVRNPARCIGCGECVLVCPSRAMTRHETHFYRLVIMGRTGKKNPRIAATFLKWATLDVVTSVIKNTYEFVDRYIDRTIAKEHIGYIVDRQGFSVFMEEVLRNVNLNSDIKIASDLTWSGYRYADDETLLV